MPFASAYAAERAAALDAAREAAAFIRSHAGRLGADAVQTKGLHDLVTFVDEGAERIIAERIQRLFPEDAFLGEEGAALSDPRAARAPDGRLWVVDPLDGTTNFAHGVPPYAVSIALLDGGRPVVGVVLEVTTGDTFVAVRGGGLELNGEAAGVSATTDLGQGLVATGFPFRDYGYAEGYLEAFGRVIRATRGVRRHGAAAVDLAWTACGRFDGFFEAGLAPWDVAAGVLLVEEGGGRVSPLVGGTDPVFSGALVASNGRVHGGLLAAAEPLGEAYAAMRPALTV